MENSNLTRNDPADCLNITGREHLWAQAIAMETGIRVASCYQCLRCTNSCPVSTFMDLKPHQVVRLVLFGESERLLTCSAIWVCLSCEMCSTYCPNEIDVAGLMNHLKNTVVRDGRTPAEYDIAAFHEVFLNVLRRNGRINDLQLMQLFKWRTMMHGKLPSGKDLRADLSLGINLLKRKRLRFLPERSPAVGEIRRIVQQLGRTGRSS